MPATSTFISEPLVPVEASFDTSMMAAGEPGLPRLFRWRKREWRVAEVLESWKEHGDCAHGSGERYVRKHVYRIRTIDGWVLRLHFQRSFGRGRFRMKSRWWVYSVETAPAGNDISEQAPHPRGPVSRQKAGSLS